MRSGVRSGPKHLDGNNSIEIQVTGFVDDAHAALSQNAFDLDPMICGKLANRVGVCESSPSCMLAEGKRASSLDCRALIRCHWMRTSCKSSG